MIKRIIARIAALAETRIKTYGGFKIARLICPGESVHPLVTEYFKSGIPGSPLDLFDYRLCSRRELRSINEKWMPGAVSGGHGLVLIGSTPCGDLLALEVRNSAVHVLSHEMLWARDFTSRGAISRSRILKTAIRRFSDIRTFLNDWERSTRAIVDEQRRFAEASRRDPNAVDADGWAPLHHAVFYGEEMKVRSLLNRGADVDLDDKKGDTPIYCGSHLGKMSIARLLIRAGTDVNHRNHHRETPLMHAVYCSNLPFVKLLLKMGADVSARDDVNRRAIDWICPVHGTMQMKRVLRNAMRKSPSRVLDRRAK